jgi:hypothetical protein
LQLFGELCGQALFLGRPFHKKILAPPLWCIYWLQRVGLAASSNRKVLARQSCEHSNVLWPYEKINVLSTCNVYSIHIFTLYYCETIFSTCGIYICSRKKILALCRAQASSNFWVRLVRGKIQTGTWWTRCALADLSN